MHSRGVLFGIALSTLTLITAASTPNRALADADFVISYATSSSVLLNAGGSKPNNATGEKQVSASVSGDESSECEVYGRQSMSSGTAQTAVSEQPAGFTARQTLSALTQGGHYRTCFVCTEKQCVGLACVPPRCVGPTGHDTIASATASTKVTARIEFSHDIKPQTFNLHLAPSQPNTTSLMLTRAGAAPTPVTAVADPIPLTAKAGDVIYVEASTNVASSNSGGCCSDNQSLDSQVKMQLERAPVIDSRANLRPFITGGDEVRGESFNYVVAILLGRKLHCTGTIIGKHTILTAAHCINGFEKQIAAGRMSVIVGHNINQPSKGPFPVLSGLFHPEGAGCTSIEISCTHDIGILATKDDLPSTTAVLYRDEAKWSSVADTSLTFVGFGYTVDNFGKHVGIGVMRELPWAPSKSDDWRFYYSASANGTGNTCMGDSGGPAFYQERPSLRLLLVGVTSGGDADCSFGVDARVDANYEWITAHLN